MTRLERLQAERDRLIMWRNTAMRNNDLLNMNRAQEKINAVGKDIEQAKQYMPMRLLDILNGKGEKAKNKVYKALIKVSLASDFVAACAYEAKEVLKEVGVNDWTFRADLEEIRKLSDKIAGFVCFDKNSPLTDMMIDDDKFIASCNRAANKRLKETLKL